MRKPHLAIAIVIIVLVGTIVAGTFLFRHRQAAQSVPARSTSSSGPTGAEPAHIRGAVDAPVTLEKFGDFECPPCGMVAPYLDEFEKTYRGKLRLVFREFPMPVHTHAARAAAAAEAAGLQNKFWEMHDLLYGQRLVWPRAENLDAKLAEYAAQIQLDVERFKRDLDSAEVKNRIAADQARGTALGVTKTPALFVNGQIIAPKDFSPVGIRQAIETALQRSPAAGAKTNATK